MNHVQTPQTAEEKKYLEEECGLKAYKPHAPPAWSDPDRGAYHVFSLGILGGSLAGRFYA